MRVYYSQKTESIIKKFELVDWRSKIYENLDEKHQNLSDNWLSCALGERMKIEGRFLKNVKDLTPEAIKLGYISKKDYERIVRPEKMIKPS